MFTIQIKMMSCNIRSSSLLLVWLLTLVYSFKLNSCSANSTTVLCLETERQALLRFKQDLIVPSNRLISWTASLPDCCKWDEIVCDDFTGHIKELHLQNPYDPDLDYRNFPMFILQGKINPCLLELKHLEYLDLSYNDFGGIPIPNFIGSMVSLTYLNISKASFQGSIPHQLGNLSNLLYLSIRGYSLYVENLHWLKNLSSLVHLDFQDVNLSAASHEWLGIMNSLPSLQELHLSSCELAFIPSWNTVNFTSLSVLEISFNFFRNASIPKWILSLSKLKFLELSENGIAGPIPNGMSNLSYLSILNLHESFLTSPSLDWLFALKSLTSLSLGGIDFGYSFSTDIQNQTSLKHLTLVSMNFPNNTIPKWVYKFPHLESLEISFNLQGQISSSIQNLSSLAILDLSENELEGAIPIVLRNLCNLQEIYLSYNKLRGEISKALESISGCNSLKLRVISLGSNKFSDTLSDSFQRLPSLTNLDLFDNQLVGNIPQSLGTLLNLQSLDISRNKLEGIVSEVHFRNLTKLRDFWATNNNLTLKVDSNWVPPFHLESLDLRRWSIGPQFPLWIQTQHDLDFLDLSCTGIIDPFPSWFWNHSTYFDYLNLSHNQISGELPSGVGPKAQYPISSYISLSSNKIIGPLPQISGNIIQLDLSNNSLSGSMSSLLCNPMNQVNRLVMLHLGGNNLSGDIPDCWKHWQSLEVISLENNQLTGNIPNSISHLTQLQSLHLRNNKLFGEIPASLGNCSMLIVLDIGFNYLDGKLPSWLGSLANLIVLALPRNNLEGKIPSEFCNLISLQVLDISANNFSGSIPTCINNLIALSSPQNLDYYEFEYPGYENSFIENIFIVIKGRGDQYDTILRFVTSIDISGNKLSGFIPKEITALFGLRFLNLSRNELIGDIPINIGDMQVLESFDLSRNQISGQIPPSMSSMHFLNYLNLSCNNLSGEIPLGTQLQSFNSSSFVGNKLCGRPLTVNCSTHAMPPKVNKGSPYEGGGTKVEGFYVAMVIGFVVGFWGICGPLLFSHPWRISYYGFLNTVWCRLCVKWQLMWRLYRWRLTRENE